MAACRDLGGSGSACCEWGRSRHRLGREFGQADEVVGGGGFDEPGGGCHSFRATGITVYLKNGGLLEHAQQMAAHESARTTKLYDRRSDKITLDEVEKIML